MAPPLRRSGAFTNQKLNRVAAEASSSPLSGITVDSAKAYMAGEGAGEQAPRKGPQPGAGGAPLKSAAEQVKAAGQGEDTHLVHVNADEFAMLKKLYGGSVNRTTGLPQFDPGYGPPPGGGRAVSDSSDGSGGGGGDSGGDGGGGEGGWGDQEMWRPPEPPPVAPPPPPPPPAGPPPGWTEEPLPPAPDPVPPAAPPAAPPASPPPPPGNGWDNRPSWLDEFLNAMRPPTPPVNAPPVSTPTTALGTVSGLTPDRNPRFRSRRYAGTTARNFTG